MEFFESESRLRRVDAAFRARAVSAENRPLPKRILNPGTLHRMRGLP
jgi:hypothetical protein